MTRGNTVSVLLIDGENIPAKFAGRLAELTADAGRDIIANVYGDFSGGALNEWRDRAAKFGFRLHQTSGKPGGRNSADMLLALDAIDILFATDHWHFCIASGDGDFTALAIRLRMSRRVVTGVGMKNSSPAFRAACNRFDVLEDAVAAPSDPAAVPLSPAACTNDIGGLFDTVVRMGLEADPEGWVSGSPLGAALRKLFPDIEWRDFGGASLKKALLAHGGFEFADDAISFKVRRRKSGQPAGLRMVAG